jgi:hypothetical protein
MANGVQQAQMRQDNPLISELAQLPPTAKIIRLDEKIREANGLALAGKYKEAQQLFRNIASCFDSISHLWGPGDFPRKKFSLSDELVRKNEVWEGLDLEAYIIRSYLYRYAKSMSVMLESPPSNKKIIERIATLWDAGNILGRVYGFVKMDGGDSEQRPLIKKKFLSECVDQLNGTKKLMKKLKEFGTAFREQDYSSLGVENPLVLAEMRFLNFKDRIASLRDDERHKSWKAYRDLDKVDDVSGDILKLK